MLRKLKLKKRVFKIVLKREIRETKKMLSLRKKINKTEKEILFMKNQQKEVFYTCALIPFAAGLFILPGGSTIMLLITKALKKFNVELKYKSQEKYL